MYLRNHIHGDSSVNRKLITFNDFVKSIQSIPDESDHCRFMSGVLLSKIIEENKSNEKQVLSFYRFVSGTNSVTWIGHGGLEELDKGTKDNADMSKVQPE